MIQRKWFVAAAFCAATMIGLAAQVQAQATRTWVSGVGADTNACSRTAPCKTFAGAYGNTATGGEINVLDSGGFGALTITHAITIRAVGVEAGILTAGTNGITIAAGSTDAVSLIGLDLYSVLPNATAVYGIDIVSAGSVLVAHSDVRNYTHGIHLAPTAGTTKVTVEDSTIAGSGTGVSVSRKAAILLDHVELIGNTFGVSVAGDKATAILNNSTIFGSAKPLSATNGGTIQSFGNNRITDAGTSLGVTGLSLQ